jgi:protein tyrosine phosphatase
MVTREVEGGSLKCHRYWPDPTSKPSVKEMKFEKIKVEFLDSRAMQYFIYRRFRLTKGKDESRIIHHFQYEAWPDHGVPFTSREFLDFRSVINSVQSSPGAPIVIHCSAGVGRTGTYIAIDRFVPILFIRA